MERFSWHVADKGVPYGEVLRIPESGEAPVTGRGGVCHNGDGEKNGDAIRWRGMYQRLVKVDPLKCVLYGSQMRFTGLKRGYRLTEQVLMHEPLVQQRVCG